MLNSPHQELTFDHPVEIQKQSAPEKAEVPEPEPKKEPEPEPKERTVTVLKLTEGGLAWSGCLRTSVKMSREKQQQLDMELQI